MAEADTVLPDVGNPPPPAPVEVDVESGEVADVSAVETPAPPPPEKKPAIPRPQARIRELSSENQQVKSYAQQLENELRQAREEAAKERANREQAERAGMENYASKVKSDLESATQELARAEEANDVPAKVAAQTKLAKAAAADSDVEAWRASLPKDEPKPQVQPQAQPQQQQPQRQQPQEQPLSEAVLDFATGNPWFDAVQRDEQGYILRDRSGKPVANPEYNARAHNAAMLIHNDIVARIEDGELDESYIETPEYFQEIAEGVKQRFPKLAGGEQQQTPAARPRTPPMAPSRQPVAPASRTAVPGQNNGTKQGNKVRLDAEQVELVNRMVDNGTMRYSNKHPDPNKRGQKMDYKDAYLEYARRAAEITPVPQQ